jgi:hypothetical protein
LESSADNATQSAVVATQAKKKRGRPKKAKHLENVILRADCSSLEEIYPAFDNADRDKKWVCDGYIPIPRCSFKQKSEVKDAAKSFNIAKHEPSIRQHLHDADPAPIASSRRKVGRPKKRRRLSGSARSSEHFPKGEFDSELCDHSTLSNHQKDAISKTINFFSKHASKHHH